MKIVTMYFEMEEWAALDAVARQLSIEHGTYVSKSQLVREAVREKFLCQPIQDRHKRWGLESRPCKPNAIMDIIIQRKAAGEDISPEAIQQLLSDFKNSGEQK